MPFPQLSRTQRRIPHRTELWRSIARDAKRPSLKLLQLVYVHRHCHCHLALGWRCREAGSRTAH
eukprot:scaffold391495_cov51-Attheya_sp.AAC.1